ncbi:MAG: hypothetical protein M3164_06010 [Actinomycetota bacterium]|nr:hypothetical protein [Actinomycetota bacterium]
MAEGNVKALDGRKVRIPIVVRLAGTNAEVGRQILRDFNHPSVVSAKTMLEAATRAVEATG